MTLLAESEYEVCTSFIQKSLMVTHDMSHYQKGVAAEKMVAIKRIIIKKHNQYINIISDYKGVYKKQYKKPMKTILQRT